MIGTAQAFSSRYAQARAQFLDAAAAAGLPVESHPHPLPGRDGEALALDVVRDGPADARHLLIVSSACHGVEGHCGSGVQVFALHDEAWRAKARDAGVAVLYLHALNPHGFSHTRRVTHENVDLNRNFHDFRQPLPANAAYREIAALLLPAQWPPTPENERAVGAFIAAHGEAAWQAAITRGQHEFPEGLFFGGTEATWSNRTLRQVLRAHGAAAEHIAWIDLHTGLGPNGHGERIYAGRDDADAILRARRWWDGGGATPVTSIYDGSSTSAFLTGLMWNSVYDECPRAGITGIALEYGTVPVLEVLQALRADHWLHLHPEAPAAQAEAIRQQVRAAFYTDTDAWKQRIVEQAREAMFQAVHGLAAPA
ncbi:M14 family metallopeptidase [Acidovorax sp. NCPPB 4044]|uniref:M14 family metallopeptidase n=1 Tax=Acidovorax sp. NCPPB 4044 TaxID=2940490 RepID=UPI0023035BD4|nr:M14 family metallopeptidase [Acidovorax sp. NCPPB 4044]MDA8522678.1 M14 family metallopeptidase [Acidovorax sp. NCPPB 4044]